MTDGQYTDKQRQVLSRLPATTAELAAALDITRPAARSRLNRINRDADKADILKETPEGSDDPVYFTDDPEHVAQISSKHKQTVTREANERLQELEQDLSQVLKRTNPTTVDVSAPTADEDLVIHRSDTHIGQVVYDDRGQEVFNTDIAIERERKVTERALALARERRRSRDVETVHLLLGGDVVTNENIYDHQPFQVDRTLDKQIEIGTELFYQQVCTLAETFEKVHVVCQPGNHGEIRASGQSKQANADRIVYGNLDLLVRQAGPGNVHVERSDATNYVNFDVRGWRGHLRHGQDLHAHVGTSAPGNKWKAHRLHHDFDIAYWGHYHEPLIHHVHGARCIRSGSVCPPSDFEESLGEWAAPAAYIHAVTDDAPFTWSEPIRFD